MNKIERALLRTTDTKFCVLGAGVVNDCASVFTQVFPGRKAVIVADRNTWKAAGEAVFNSFQMSNVPQEKAYIFEDEHFYAEWSFVEKLQEHLCKIDAIAVAVGSGVINDLCKYVSGQLGRPYMCVGTAASMDGFTAYGASITKDGNKQTFSCPAPYAVVMDSQIAALAPKELCASGYADLIAKIPAAADWMIADCVGAEKIDTFSWALVQDGLKESLSRPSELKAGDLDATEGLCEGLLMSGFAMQAMQSSRPASGTEHQFSHFWDMEALSYPDGTHVSHGFKVGIGTLVSTAALEFLLKKGVDVDENELAGKWLNMEDMECYIRQLCAGREGHLRRCLQETRGKWVDAEGLKQQIRALKKNWPGLKESIRAQIIPFSKLYEYLKAAGAPYEPEMICVSRERLRDTLRFIPFMRSRFTGMDVIYRLGYMDEFSETLFGKGRIWEI